MTGFRQIPVNKYTPVLHSVSDSKHEQYKFDRNTGDVLQRHRKVAESVSPSVVSVSSDGRNGTGIVWDDQGHIVTAYHVVQGLEEVEVGSNSGETFTAKVVGRDKHLRHRPPEGGGQARAHRQGRLRVPQGRPVRPRAREPLRDQGERHVRDNHQREAQHRRVVGRRHRGRSRDRREAEPRILGRPARGRLRKDGRA